MSSAPQPSPEFAAGFREAFLQGLEFEIPTTMKVIAAVPDAKRDWKPDPKARSAWELAWHIASEDVIFLEQIAEGKFSFPDSRYEKEQPATTADMAEWYQRRMKDAIAKVRKMTPQQLVQPLDFLGMFKFPAFVYFTFMSNHSIHHRGQLSTYLRPMGGKVPSIYGGSADEPMPM